MKLISLFIATAVPLAAAVLAAGFALDFAVLLAIGCAAGVVGLFAHDYRRARRRFQLRTHRAAAAHSPLRLNAGTRSPAPLQPAPTLGG